jgi:hypothetical protein
MSFLKISCIIHNYLLLTLYLTSFKNNLLTKLVNLLSYCIYIKYCGILQTLRILISRDPHQDYGIRTTVIVSGLIF